MFAAVGMLFTACNKDCGHEFIEHDHSEDIVGTWTYLNEEGQAEAMVINPDGSFAITGIMNGGYLYEEKGTIKVVNNKVTLAYNSGDVFESRLELVVGKSMSIVFNKEYDVCLTYDYCANDLSDEIIGMWVCNDGVAGMAIQTYQEDGKCFYTGFSLGENDYLTTFESTYGVFGDMLFQKTGDRYFATRLTYIPGGNSLGDILSSTSTILVNDEYVTSSYSFLRVKQDLNLNNGKTYDYSSAYVTNVKGKDEDFSIVGNTFNMANIKAGNFDVMFRSVLYCVEFGANSIKQNFLVNGVHADFDTPITVEGNKVTLDMSKEHPALRKVEMYIFQDADDSQLHIFMPTKSFINYFANLKFVTLLTEGKIDPTNTAAVEKIYTDMEARIESINVSFVLKVRK